MTLSGLGDRTRQRLQALVADDRMDPGKLLAQVREIRARDHAPAFSFALLLLAQLERPEQAAETLLSKILDHRRAMAQSLGRDPGLRVAALDFLCNVEPVLTAPVVVETTRLEEMERSAVTDALTGLYNRRFFTSVLEREIQRSRRYGLVLSLVMLDLDDFKQINDDYGHLFGDLVLRRAARLARRAIRDSDLACRFGGEEFVVILPETDRLGCFALAERIRRVVETSFRETPTGGREIAMTVSGGISSYPADGRVPKDLIQIADRTLYRAKTLGKNRIALHPTEHRGAVRYPARPAVRVEVAPESREVVAAVPVNFSRTGALLELTEPLQTADLVRLRLDAHGGAQSAEAWHVQGQVVRVEPGRLPPWRYRVGIAFDEPLPEPCLRAQIQLGQAAGAASGGAGR